MRLGGVLTQASDAVLLILLEVALEPIPVAGVLVGALPRQDVGVFLIIDFEVLASLFLLKYISFLL